MNLYWLHMWDFLTQIDEIMRTFDDLVRAGKCIVAAELGRRRRKWL
jgi:aryl-alcohol dehydrogenase-like predicted oxidoreductase